MDTKLNAAKTNLDHTLKPHCQVNKNRHYGSVEILSTVQILSIQEGLDLIANKTFPQKGIKNYELAKSRLDCFLHKGCTCVCCKLQAKYFAIEEIKSKSFTGLSLNLYGIKDGKEVFFTKDHIFPKSLGGLDHLDNYQTMCWRCNSLKGNKII